MVNKGFSSLLGDLCLRYNSNLFVLFDTHVSGPRAQRLIAKFGFDSNHVVNGDGFSRGI